MSLWFLLLWSLADAISRQQIDHYRETVREMFYHGYDNYMKYAFPMDELNPLRCGGKGRDYLNPHNDINDILGDYCLTLVDSLDTLLILGDKKEFVRAVGLIQRFVNFERHANTVQVFESTIRVLGGLLSAHVMATDPKMNITIPGYRNQLLNLAYDLGKRLLPAFETETGIPYPRINLVYGVPTEMTNTTCSAGAGSLLLEFAMLSRLTGDERFEKVARKALIAVWERRSQLNLIGNSIDAATGRWITVDSGIGAGIDSFHEYLLKAYILLGDLEYLDMFEKSYAAILNHVRDNDGFLYRPVHMDSASPISVWIDSLSAFFPGVQVLYGDIENAARLHELYYTIWRKYNALPERFDYRQKSVNLAFYPLRPELIESTYALYQATRNPYYLEAGMTFVKDLQKYARKSCGFASIKHVIMKTSDDRMESFFLSETLKYLYLLFDTEHYLNKWDSHFVFTTEAHPLYLHQQSMQAHKNPFYMEKASTMACLKSRNSQLYSLAPRSPLKQTELDFIDHLVGTDGAQPIEAVGMCVAGVDRDVLFQPKTMDIIFDLEVFARNYGFSKSVNLKKATIQWTERGDILLDTLHGLRLFMSSTQPEGINIARINTFTVPSEKKIFIDQTSLITFNNGKNFIIDYEPYILRIFKYPSNVNESELHFGIGHKRNSFEDFHAIPASFGVFKKSSDYLVSSSLLVYFTRNEFGCNPFTREQSQILSNETLLLKRGECFFYEKVRNAEAGGAKAVLVINSDNSPLQMSPMEDKQDEIKIPSFMMSQTAGARLFQLLKPYSDFETREVRLSIFETRRVGHFPWPVEEEILERNLLRLGEKRFLNLYVLSQREFKYLKSVVEKTEQKVKPLRSQKLLPGMGWISLFKCCLNRLACC